MDTNNIYKAPEVDLIQAEQPESEPIFFSASTLKFCVMYLCSFGFYGLYWFYKNWNCISNIERRPYSPVIRTIFSVLTSYGCFKKIFEEADRYDIKVWVPAWLLALLYAVFSLTSKLPAPLSALTFLSVLPLIPVNIIARKVNQHCIANFKDNAKFSLWNWVLIVPGGLFLILALVGLLLPISNR